MPLNPLVSPSKSRRTLHSSVKRTVRRIPPDTDDSYSFGAVSERLQPVKYGQYDDTVFFKPKESNGPIIGYVRINFWGKKLNIDFLEVYKPFRRRGFGREIYDWTESYAKEKGIERITVISLEEAVGYWKKMQFKRGVWSKTGYLSMFKTLTDSENWS